MSQRDHLSRKPEQKLVEPIPSASLALALLSVYWLEYVYVIAFKYNLTVCLYTGKHIYLKY